MRIDCPACAASYDVPDALLAGRKAVRCARCGGQWAPPAVPAPDSLPPPPVPADLVPPVTIPDPPRAGDITVPARLAARSTPRRRSGLGLAWAASIVLLALALAATVVWRERIAQVWPPSQRVYTAFGLGFRAR